MATPGMVDELQRVSEEGGTAVLIDYLGAHGLRWRAGGSDPAAAFADGLEVEWFGELIPALPPRAVPNRKARRKAARAARRTTRRR